MTAPFTPRSTASMQVSTFGIMPPVIQPSAMPALHLADRHLRDQPPSGSSTPATSVSISRRSAPSAPAIAPATVSALML